VLPILGGSPAAAQALEKVVDRPVNKWGGGEMKRTWFGLGFMAGVLAAAGGLFGAVLADEISRQKSARVYQEWRRRAGW